MNVSVIGLGQRGYNYIRWIKLFVKGVEVVAVCDKNKFRTDESAAKYKVPQRYYDEDEFFKERRSDAIIVATQDRDHVGHCIRAIDAGYKNILVEKPVSPSIEECERLDNYAREHGATIVVCHVLRYSKYYRDIKQIIESGRIGKVIDVQQTENVGYFHFAHSFVRGNWHSEEETSPFILAKCCHDFDIISWLIDKPCVSVSSYGGLTYFTEANAPKGASDRCKDCKVSDCKYNAYKLYLNDPLYKATFLRFSGSIVTAKYRFTRAEEKAALDTGDYGRCVFRCDNDVADHQVVNFLFEDGVTASHTVNACTDKFCRSTVVYGTKGEIRADDYTGKIRVRVFGGKRFTISTKLIKGLGHIDGDINLIRGWCKLIQGIPYDTKDVTFLSETIKSHRAAIMSDISRKEGGKVIQLKN